MNRCEYKRLTKSIDELVQIARQNPDFKIHGDDNELIQIPVGYLRDLEDLYFYCEKALPMLKKFFLVKRMIKEDILGEERKTSLETEEGILYANIDFALGYLVEHSKEYQKREREWIRIRVGETLLENIESQERLIENQRKMISLYQSIKDSQEQMIENYKEIVATLKVANGGLREQNHVLMEANETLKQMSFIQYVKGDESQSMDMMNTQN